MSTVLVITVYKGVDHGLTDSLPRVFCSLNSFGAPNLRNLPCVPAKKAPDAPDHVDERSRNICWSEADGPFRDAALTGTTCKYLYFDFALRERDGRILSEHDYSNGNK